MFGKRKTQESTTDAEHIIDEPEDDPETGLLGAARFEDAIQKEIARGLRYGSSSALAIFEVGVAERSAGGPIPSPAKFVANVLRKAARSSDIVARVAPQSFAVLLVEARGEGAKQFTEPLRPSAGRHRALCPGLGRRCRVGACIRLGRRIRRGRAGFAGGNVPRVRSRPGLVPRRGPEQAVRRLNLTGETRCPVGSLEPRPVPR